MSGKVPELCDLSDILTMINPTYLSQLVLPEKGKVASTIDTLGINVMTYATNLINNQNPQVVSIKHLNADSPLKSLASLDILKRSELLERFDWNGKDVFGYSNKQAPDAVYECTLQPAVINGRSQKFIIFFESDQQSKDKERRKVAMKMWQATDVCRLHTTSELSVPAYTIRANLKWYHNSEYKNWQMSKDDIEKVYERTHRGGTPWKDLTADEKFEQKDKISKTQRRGHLQDILNAFLMDLCKSFVQVAYDMVQHTVNLYHKSNKKSTMFSTYFNESVKSKDAVVWDLHVFVGNFYFTNEMERIKIIQNRAGHETWFGYTDPDDDELQTMLDLERRVKFQNEMKRITLDMNENFDQFKTHPIWLTKFDDELGEVRPDAYLCQHLFQESNETVTRSILSPTWNSWNSRVIWSHTVPDDVSPIPIIVLGVERVNIDTSLFPDIEKNKSAIKDIKDKLQEIRYHWQETGSSQFYEAKKFATEKLINTQKSDLDDCKNKLKELNEDSDIEEDRRERKVKKTKQRISKIIAKKLAFMAQVAEDVFNIKQAKKIESYEKKLNELLLQKHNVRGMWYVTDISWLMKQGPLYMDVIFNSSNIEWRTIKTNARGHPSCGYNSLHDFKFNTPPKRYNFSSMTQREHFSQPWYKVITEPVMNVMENFFYDLIETLSWNSTKRSLDINMITLIDDVRRKRVRSPGIPLYRSHLHKQPDEPERDMSKMSLTRICLKSLSSTLPSKGKDMEELRAYLDKYHVPHAFTFFRMIRCPNIIALQEISRQCFSDPELKKRFDKYLSMMPLGMQTEILYILTDVRTGVSRKQSQPTASDSDSDSVEIVHSRSPSPDAGTGDDGDGSDGGGDDDDIHDDRGQSPALQSDSDQPPSGDNVLQMKDYPFKPRPTYKYVYDFFKTSKDLYVWFPDIIDGKEHPSRLAPGWHKVAALTQPSEKHRRTEPNFYEMKFDKEDFRGADDAEKKRNHERYNSKSPPWSFSLPRSLYYPANPQGNWTVLYNHVVTIQSRINRITGDGHCLYRAIAWFEHADYRSEPAQMNRVRDYRAECAWYYEEHIQNVEDAIKYDFASMEEVGKYVTGLLDKAHGTHKELIILSQLLNMNYRVYEQIPGTENKFYLTNQENFVGATRTGHYLYTRDGVDDGHYDVLELE